VKELQKIKYAPIFVISAAVLWGFDGIILRPSLYVLPVTLVVFVESLLTTILLTPVLFKQLKTIKLIENKDLLAFFAVALFGGAIGTMAITKALFYVNYVNLSIVIFIQKLQPIFALSLASILLKERLPKEFFIWASLAIFGAYIMTFGFSLPATNTGDKTIDAAFFALIAAASFAASTVFSKRALKNVSFYMGTYLRFLISSILMFFIILGFGQISSLAELTSHQILIFFLIAFSSGGFAIFLYYYGLKQISASRAAIYELAFPLSAVLLEFFVHDKILNLVQWIGVIMLTIGIMRVTKTADNN